MADFETRVLHKIVNHLPVAPYIKDELLKEVSRVFGELEETTDAEE
jgi:hypothetical protein